MIRLCPAAACLEVPELRLYAVGRVPDTALLALPGPYNSRGRDGWLKNMKLSNSSESRQNSRRGLDSNTVDGF